MKKLLLLLTLLVAFSVTACKSEDPKTDPVNNEQNDGTNNDENKDDENKDDENKDGENSDSDNVLDGSLDSILEKIYETAIVSNNFKEYAQTGLIKTEIIAGQSAYHLGTDDIEFEAALASEPMMSTSAYTLCLVRAKEGADIEAMKTSIKENVDPMKWICVGVDPENVIVDSIDDVIILIMSNDEAKPLHDAFLALKK